MKKEYLNPTTSVIYIETAHMIAASLEIGDPLEDAFGAEARGEVDIFDIAK